MARHSSPSETASPGSQGVDARAASARASVSRRRVQKTRGDFVCAVITVKRDVDVTETFAKGTSWQPEPSVWTALQDGQGCRHPRSGRSKTWALCLPTPPFVHRHLEAAFAHALGAQDVQERTYGPCRASEVCSISCRS